jgi:hypothetical protein
MNDIIKITLATAAVIYGMTAQLPANETVKETQDAINKWYDDFSTTMTTDLTRIGVSIVDLPGGLAQGVINIGQDIKEYQKESWTRAGEENQQTWETIKGWFAPKSEEVKK